ncbi:MAG TPA: arginase family protein, partial [Chitinophagaceae bacterium]|nr:arginase family protein [Chitinophagaceae bacterium]
MSDYLNIADFLEPVNPHALNHDGGFKDGQLGKMLATYDEEFPDLDEVQVVLLGCGEQRGSGLIHGQSEAPDVIRRQLYSLYYWHHDIRVADLGNIRTGSLYTDTYAALRTVIQELIRDGKTVVILGGTHDLTLAQYGAYAEDRRVIEASCVDALVDLNIDSPFRHENFLMEML